MTEEKRAVVTSPPRKVFWAMQYSEPFIDVYNECKKQLEAEYDFITPLENQDQTNIVKKVVTQISEADFVVVDVSYIALGDGDRPLFNGNVMFELGYAMTLPRNVIMISCRDKKYLPFDFNAYNVEFYNPCRPSELCAKLKKLLSDSIKFGNPITDWLREPRTPPQIKEQEATEQTAKESPFDVAQLSDAAIELLVYAALSQEKELRLQDNEIRFGLKPKTPAFYFDFPEQAPANSDVLAELVDCGALTQSRYKYVLNQEFVDKHLDAALEIDAQRIAHSLPEPGRQILNAARQEGDAVCCEHRSASSQAGFYAISAVAEHLGSAPALDVCRVLLMFQKNGLVNQWFLKEGPQSVPLFAPDDLPSHLKFNENAPTHGTITFIGGAPDRWKPYPRQSPNIGWNWAEGRLTKRGEEIAALLSPPAEPSV